MKKFYGFLLFLLIHQVAMAKIEFHFNQIVFFDGQNPYVECAFSINPLSVNYKTRADKKLQGTITVTIFFKQNDKVIQFDKFNLLTKKYDSAALIVSDASALLAVKRYSLAPGEYQVDVELQDGISSEEQKNIPLKVTAFKPALAISSIELLDTFYTYTDTARNNFFKSGVLAYPYVLDYYPASKNYLTFYSEIYYPEKAGLTPKFIVRYSILKLENKEVLASFTKSEVLSSAEIVPVLNTLPIGNLMSGNYIFRIELCNRANEVLASKELDFQRSKSTSSAVTSLSDLNKIDFTDVPYRNSFIDKFSVDEMVFRLNSIRPIADMNEERYIDNLLRDKKEVFMKGFYYNFWLNHYPGNMIAGYNAYEKALIEVNKTFTSQRRFGYETDRGRTYLHYGAPNSIQEVKNDPDALPYEVWNYYDIGNQKNIVFVFYAPDRSTNEYVLIHSNARGERNDPKWAAIIQGSRPTSDYNNLDKSGYQRNSGGRLQDIYGRPILDQTGVR
jgi:GWxTD domain-containing protein